jgi:hypothetical protein
MDKVLLKWGGTRVGDQLHAIPLLKSLKDNGLSVDLVHGRYELDASKLLQYIGLVDNLYSYEFVDGHINSDMNSIKKFLEYIGTTHDKDYDIIIEPERNENGFTGVFTSNKDIGINLRELPWATPTIPDVVVGDYERSENYIGVQPASISTFKTYNSLYSIEYPGDVKSFGFQYERPIANAIRINGKTLIEVYEEMKTCCMIISTHSAIGVLAYYLGIPQIFIHFWKGGLANLTERENVVQLYEPGKLDIQIEIDNMWNKLNKKELVYEN